MTADRVRNLTVFVGGRAVADAPTDPVDALTFARVNRGWVWLELADDADGDEIGALGEAYGLAHLAVEDAIESGQRTKFDRHGEQGFMVLYAVGYDDAADRVDLSELSLFIGPDYVVTLRRGKAGDVREARNRLLSAPRLAALGPDGAAYAVLDAVVDDYQPAADGLQMDIEEIDAGIDDHDDELAKRVYRLNGQVSRFLMAIAPLESMVSGMRKSLVGGDPTLLAEGTAVLQDPDDPVGRPGDAIGEDRLDHHQIVVLDALLGDVLDHVLRVEARLSNMHTSLNGALSLISTLASQRATDLGLVQAAQSKKISSWAAILAVPTIIAGIYGMNFTFMPELDWPFGYAFAWGFMLLSSGVLYVTFKKNDWL